MLLLNDFKQIYVPLKWSINDFEIYNKNIIVINKLNHTTLNEIGREYLSGYIKCTIGEYDGFENAIEDQIDLYLDDEQNYSYIMEISPNEAMEIAEIYTFITNFNNMQIK